MKETAADMIARFYQQNVANGLLDSRMDRNLPPDISATIAGTFMQAPAPAPSRPAPSPWAPPASAGELHPDPGATRQAPPVQAHARSEVQAPSPRQAPAPAPEAAAKAGRRGRPRAGDRPFLLSTADTLARFDILFYEGVDYTLDPRKHSDFGARNVARVFSYVYYDIILPNALIAKGMGFRVALEDVRFAVRYAMKTGKSEKAAAAWKDFITGNEDDPVKPTSRIFRSFNWYVNDLAWNEHTGKLADLPLPPESRWTLRRYLDETPAGRFTRGLKRFVSPGTPSLNKLINAFADDRSVGALTTKEIMERFGVSKKVSTRFNKWLDQRRSLSIPDEFLVIKR